MSKSNPGYQRSRYGKCPAQYQQCPGAFEPTESSRLIEKCPRCKQTAMVHNGMLGLHHTTGAQLDGRGFLISTQGVR